MRDGGPTYGRPKPEQRLFQIAARMTAGTVGGLVRSAAPVQRGMPNVRVYREQAGGGAHFSTVMVAADNATDREKASADYQCDGTGDQAEILAAIAECTNGGLVLLSSGLFTISADITIPNYVRLAGMHQFATIIDASATAGVGIVMSGTKGTVESLYLYGDGSGIGIDTSGSGCEIHRARVENYATGIRLFSYAGIVTASHVYDCGTGISILSQRARIEDNLVEFCATGIVVDDDAAAVIGNQVHALGHSSLGHGIHVTNDGNFAEVVGNVVSSHLNNVHVEGTECLVNANRSDEPDNHCFYWAGYRGTLHDNVAGGAGGAVSNTYDCFHIADGAGSSIQGNSGSGGTARYGIRLEAAATDHLVTNNDVLSGASGTTWGTAAFSDAGTGTVTTSGNRT